jgi:putative spermidine/putrescine transport system ATP-binding protein
VFQNYALFPHLSVRENVAFGLRARRMATRQMHETVEEMLALVRMQEFAGRPVTALSGGQQQRVAVARALAIKPRLLLLDEPFSALDRQLRETMQVELKTLLRERDMTAVFVTHDQDEALAVSDRIAVMNAGVIEQFDVPNILYSRPASAFVMDFVGLSTRLSGSVSRLTQEHVVINTGLGEIRAPRIDLTKDYGAAHASTSISSNAVPEALAPGVSVTLGIRPECLSLVNGRIIAEQTSNKISTVVSDTMCLGSRTLMHCRAPAGDRLISESRSDEASAERGQNVELCWQIADTLIYPAT